MLSWLLMGLAGCTPAGQLVGGRLVVDPGFSVAAPHPDQWKQVKNRRWRDEVTIVYRYHVRGRAALSMKVIRMPPETWRIPLEVLAEAYFRTVGAGQGVEAEVAETLSVVVGEQASVVLFGTWMIRPVTQQVVQVAMRSPEGLVVISLIAPPAHFDAFASDLDNLLRDFRLETRQPPDPYLLDTIPMEAPDEDPGHFGPE